MTTRVHLWCSGQNKQKEVNRLTKQKSKTPCLPELLNFYRSELIAVRQQMEQSLEHLIAEETLAALGAWNGMERRIAFAGCALQILAQPYPSGIQSHATDVKRKEDSNGRKETVHAIPIHGWQWNRYRYRS